MGNFTNTNITRFVNTIMTGFGLAVYCSARYTLRITNGAVMRIETEIQQTLEAFRHRLIELISAKRPGDYASLTLPELYAIASKRVARLHQDVRLFQLYYDLGCIDTGFDEHGNVELLGVNAWIEAGMSPIIYFAGQFKFMQAPASFLEKIGAKTSGFPGRQQLLGNLSLAEFSVFLADRVSYATMTYYWLRLLTAEMPELIEPHNWHNLKTGRNRIDKKFRAISGQLLQDLVPLLLIERGHPASLYAEAKRQLNLDNAPAPEGVVRKALYDAIDPQGMAVLERYVQAEYGGWDAPAFDKVLRGFMCTYSFRSIRTRAGRLESDEELWVQKALEQVKRFGTRQATWPAMLYARFLMDCCAPGVSEGQQNLLSLRSLSPAFEAIQDYALSPEFPLVEAIIDTDDFQILVHPALISLLSDSHRDRYVEYAAGKTADKVIERRKEDAHFDINPELCDPACLAVMSRRVNETINHQGLKVSSPGEKALLKIMSLSLRGPEQREQAIQWCSAIRHQETRLEAMRLLDLTLADVRLTPRLHGDFLSRDLGL
jgi:hypothetical protein